MSSNHAGEAVYVDDIPSPKDCLHGAFICSTKPLARIKGIEFKSTPASQRISTVISVKDIPKGGMNIGSKTMFGSEPLFAEDVTLYAGQPLGFVVSIFLLSHPSILRGITRSFYGLLCFQLMCLQDLFYSCCPHTPIG